MSCADCEVNGFDCEIHGSKVAIPVLKRAIGYAGDHEDDDAIDWLTYVLAVYQWEEEHE